VLLVLYSKFSKEKSGFLQMAFKKTRVGFFGLDPITSALEPNTVFY